MRITIALWIVAAAVWGWAADRQGWLLTPLCRYLTMGVGTEGEAGQRRLQRYQAEFQRDCTASALWGWHKRLG